MAARSHRATPPAIYELEISLLDSEPRIWRRFAVAGDITLVKLHHVAQLVMGWTDSHLHQFVMAGEVRYGSKHLYLDPDPDVRDERRVRLNRVLSGPGDSLLYQYDFGDGWDHLLEVIGVGPAEQGVRYPVCLAGERACPPEDSGGIYGYYEILEAIADPDHEDHEEMAEWLGAGFDPEAFDEDAVNQMLASLS